MSCVWLSTWLELLRGFQCSVHFGAFFLSLQTGPQKHSAHTESSAQGFFLDLCTVADTEVNPSWPVWFCENPGKKKKKVKSKIHQISFLSSDFPRAFLETLLCFSHLLPSCIELDEHNFSFAPSPRACASARKFIFVT